MQTTQTQQTERGTTEARSVIWDVITWFEATNGGSAFPHRIYEAARKVIPDCPCQGTGMPVADALCRCQSEALAGEVCGYELHAEASHG
jgi:hypothetical protein